jgi:hypothetical protein
LTSAGLNHIPVKTRIKYTTRLVSNGSEAQDRELRRGKKEGEGKEKIAMFLQGILEP